MRARGDIVIQFGGMRLPPFDTEAGRNELRLALNEIDGVDIPSWQLSRWPTIPLTALEDPANLDRLVKVLDRIATESHVVQTVNTAEPAVAA